MVTAQRRKLFIQPHDLVVWPSMYPGYEAHNERIRRIRSGELVYEDQEVQEAPQMSQQTTSSQLPSRWVTLDGLKVNIFCPSCGESHVALPKNIGKSSNCTSCHAVIHVTQPTSDQIHEMHSHRQQVSSPHLPQPKMTTCPFCMAPRHVTAIACPNCGRTPDGRIGKIG